MILTDDELSALWDGAVESMRTSAEPWHIRHRMGRAVERAVIDKLISDAESDTSVLRTNLVVCWLRSKRGEGDDR